MNDVAPFITASTPFRNFIDQAINVSGAALQADTSCCACIHCHKPLLALSFREDGAVFLVYCLDCNFLVLVESILCSPHPFTKPVNPACHHLFNSFETLCNWVVNQKARP